MYGVDSLRYVFDTVEFGSFSGSERQQVPELLGVLDAPLEEGGIAIDNHCSDASLYLIVVRANAGIMQEAEQFLLVVEPEDHSLADCASFPSQIPATVSLDSILFRERHYDFIDAVRLRSTVLDGSTRCVRAVA